MAVIIVIGMGRAMILRTAIVSSCMITEEQGKATSQTLRPIRSRDLNIYLEAHPKLIQAELQALPVPEYTLRLHIQAVKGHDAWDLLPMIHVPTLVIHGGDNQRVPTVNASLLAGRIPGAELFIIQGGRHGFLAEKRWEVSRVVNSFLARHQLS